MNIIVCMKQVPDHTAPRAAFVINHTENKVEFRGIQPVLSLFDENALEAALQIKDAEKDNIRIRVLSVGRRIAKRVMMKSLAVGADDLVTVEDAAFDAIRLDSFETASILVAAIEKIGHWDLILLGRQAADTNAGQTAAGIASKLGIPVITLATKVSVSQGKVIVERLIPNGYEIVEAVLPAVVTVSNEVGELRYPTIVQIREAKSKPILSLGIGDIDVHPEEAKKVKIRTLISPELNHRECKYITGETPAELGRNLVFTLTRDKIIG